MSKIRYSREQLDVIYDHGNELAVSAAAGSGKTAVLTERIIRAVMGEDEAGNYDESRRLELDRILVVTFTRKAAAELRERLAESLGAALRESQKQLHKNPEDATQIRQADILRRQLLNLGNAQVSTIHSFCQRLISEHRHKADAARLKVLDENREQQLKFELATRFLDRALGAGADAELRQLAMAWGSIDGSGKENVDDKFRDKGLRKLLLEVVDFRSSLVAPDIWLERQLGDSELSPEHFDKDHPQVRTVWEGLLSFVTEQIAVAEAELSAISAECPKAAFLDVLRVRLRVLKGMAQLHWDDALTVLKQLNSRSKAGGVDNVRPAYTLNSGLSETWKVRIKDSCQSFRDQLSSWIGELATTWAKQAVVANHVRRWARRFWQLAADFEREYTEYKRQYGLQDYNDLEQQALRMLAEVVPDMDAPGGYQLRPTAIADAQRQRFQAVFVDEYQDVNELQHCLIDMLVADEGTGARGWRPRFVVGDLKQSIYGFRLADPRIFQQHQAELMTSGRERARVLKLTTNYRTRRKLLQAINSVFTVNMTNAFGGEDYTAGNELNYGGLYEQQYTAAELGTENSETPARLHLLDTENAKADERYDAVCRHTAVLLAELKAEQAGGRARMVFDKQTGMRPVRWADMAVLVRANSQVDPLRRALEHAGIPVHATANHGFYERPEVSDLLSLLQVLDNPLLDVPFAAVLRGPVAGIDVRGIATLSRYPLPPEMRHASLWERVNWLNSSSVLAGPLAEQLQGFLERVSRWRTWARELNTPELIWRLLSDSGLVAAVAGLKNGRQRVANLYELHQLSQSFAASGRSGLARFLLFINESRRAAGDLGEAVEVSEAADVVRVMTVHKAKGLEFPYVILPFLNKEFNRIIRTGMMWHSEAGIAGQYADYREHLDDKTSSEMPRVYDTLNMERVKEAKKLDEKSEALRVLYVAMTRARERLELVAGVDAEKLAEAEQPGAIGAKAKTYLDWVLAAVPGTMLQEGGVTPDGAWEVLRLQEPVEKPEVRTREHKELPTGAISELANRLGWQYPYAAAARLPAKLTVTRLAKDTAVPHDEELGAVVMAEDEAPAEALQSRTGGAVAREYGTFVHAVLERVDLHRAVQADELAEIARGLAVDADLIRRLDATRLAAHANRVRAEYDDFSGAVLRAELPLSLLVDAATLPPEYWPDAPPPGAGEQVLVQGTVDLLAVWPERALVIDWKTGRATAAELRQRYSPQLAWYAAAVARLLPQLPRGAVRWLIAGVDSGELVTGGC